MPDVKFLVAFILQNSPLGDSSSSIPSKKSEIAFFSDSFNELEQATSSFGQGISVSMIQMATAFSSVINGGNLYEPYIVKDIVNSKTNEIILSKEPKLINKTIKKETSELMKIALESVVAKGSGGRAFINNYRVGGKTGTSQIESTPKAPPWKTFTKKYNFLPKKRQICQV